MSEGTTLSYNSRGIKKPEGEPFTKTGKFRDDTQAKIQLVIDKLRPI